MHKVKAPRKCAIDVILDEVIWYGGVLMTRREVKTEMESEGFDTRCIDYFVYKPEAVKVEKREGVTSTTTIEKKYTAYTDVLNTIEAQKSQMNNLLATRDQVVREARKSGANYQGLLQAGAPVTAQINEVEQAIRQNRNNADDAYYAYEQAKWNATPEELAQWES